MLFNVHAPDDAAGVYSLEARIASEALAITRNGAEASVSTDGLTGLVTCFVGWGPEELFVRLVQGQTGESDDVRDDEVGRVSRNQRRSTSAVIPPHGLVRWAREQDIAPRTTYRNLAFLQNQVISALLAIDARVQELGAYHPFWDVRYGERGAVEAQTPKRETNVHPTIDALLYDISTAKNIDFVREVAAGSGNLDFLATGVLESGRMARVCIEFKNAHSSHLFDGLANQLPAYMRAKQTDAGIFAVLWYKNGRFDEPRQYDQTSLMTELAGAAARVGQSTRIRIVILDFSHPTPPSQL